jgi:hypothetical protein
VLSPQAEVRFGPFAVGHIDGFVRQDGLPVLWEAKSTTGFSLAKWRKEGLPRRIAWQISAYAKGLSDLLGEQVSKILLETIDRTNGEIFSWTYDFDEAITQDALQRAEFLAQCLAQCLADGTLPDREFEANSSDCRYCPFQSTCRPDAQLPANASKDFADATHWPGFQEAIELYDSAQSLKEEGETLVSKARDSILDALRGHNVTMAKSNTHTVKWSSINASRFDSKAFQQAHPELFFQFEKTSQYGKLTLTNSR